MQEFHRFPLVLSSQFLIPSAFSRKQEFCARASPGFILFAFYNLCTLPNRKRHPKTVWGKDVLLLAIAGGFFAPQQYSSCSVTSLRDLYHFFATVHLSHDHLRDRMESRISWRLTTSATSYAGGSDSGIRFKRAIDGKCPIFP